MLDSNKSLTLILGSVDDSGIVNTLTATGRQYKKKMLDSSIENWKSILEYFDDFLINQVLIKLSVITYELI